MNKVYFVAATWTKFRFPQFSGGWVYIKPLRITMTITIYLGHRTSLFQKRITRRGFAIGCNFKYFPETRFQLWRLCSPFQNGSLAGSYKQISVFVEHQA